MERFLLSVDGSEASVKAVSYLARLHGGKADWLVHVFHVLEPIAPYFEPLHGDLEGGSEAASSDAERNLAEEARKRARPVFERMSGILHEAGVPLERIEGSWHVSAREDSLAWEVLHAARERDCSTVVVGRSALPWHRKLFHAHLGERLVKRGEGLTVWVVE